MLCYLWQVNTITMIGNNEKKKYFKKKIQIYVFIGPKSLLGFKKHHCEIYFYKDGGSAVIEFTPQVLKIYIASAKIYKIYITSAKNLQHEREARVL